MLRKWPTLNYVQSNNKPESSKPCGNSLFFAAKHTGGKKIKKSSPSIFKNSPATKTTNTPVKYFLHLCPLLFSYARTLFLGHAEQTFLLQHNTWHEQEHYPLSHMKFSRQFLKWSTQCVGCALTIKALCLCSILQLMMHLETTNKRLESLVVQNIFTPSFFLKVLWTASFSSSCEC